MLLTWAAAALTEAEHEVPRAHTAAIERIAPTLRALRHSDGGLARQILFAAERPAAYEKVALRETHRRGNHSRSACR